MCHHFSLLEANKHLNHQVDLPDSDEKFCAKIIDQLVKARNALLRQMCLELVVKEYTEKRSSYIMD